MTIRSICVN